MDQSPFFNDAYFDETTQFFNANGFAVLRVNFRGSGGHSKELREAGKKQFGELMLEDIYQATLAVVQHQYIDKKRICTVGMSYGGYAAVALTINHPEIYQCAVSLAGVMDVPYYTRSPHSTEKQRSWIADQVGNIETEYDELKSISPVYNAAKLTQPILITHGEKDQVVDVEHAYRMKLMLEKHSKEFEWYIEPDGSHSFDNKEETYRFFNRTITFLRKNI